MAQAFLSPKRDHVIGYIFIFFRVQPQTRPSRLNMKAFYPEHPEREQNPKFTPLSETTSIPTTFICGVPSPGCIVPASMEVGLIVGSLPFLGDFSPVPVSPFPLSSKIDQHPKFHVRSGSEEKYKAAGLSGSSWNFQVSPSQNIVSLDEIDTCIYMSTSSKD